MIDGLKPYPDYKDSGVLWLGHFPSHWEQRALWTISSLRAQRNPGNLPLLSIFLNRGVIPYGDGGGQVHAPSLDLSKYQVVAPGDFVLNNQQAWRGSVGVSRHHGIISPAYIVLRLSDKLDSSFANYLMRCPRMVDQFVAASKGVGDIQRQIFWPFLRTVQVPIPNSHEQAAIVRFLDHTNGRIERAIRAKRKLITLLNEQKQAIIHRAVTRGLDPTVPLKPSGIPWLAKPPAHWKWIAIKRLLSRMDYGTSEASTETGCIRVLTMGNIQKGEVIMPRSGGLDVVPDSLLLEHHDLLFTRTNGNPDLVGKVGIFRGQLSDRVSFASYLVRLRVKRSHEPQWLHMLLNSSAFWPFARSHALVNLQTNLNSTRYGQFPVPVPPANEQSRIIEWVAEACKSLNTALARTEREITLFREYRTRLVADVVTGKLDVRAAARLLPEESPAHLAEPDDTDEAAELDPEPLKTE